MWQTFVAMSQAYGVFEGDKLLACAAVDEQKRLLQYLVAPGVAGGEYFKQALCQLDVQGAVASTADMPFVAYCLDNQRGVTVHALQYELAQPALASSRTAVSFGSGRELNAVETHQLDEAVSFGTSALGADDEWLRGYYSKLIEGGELLGLWEAQDLIATGEHRPSMTQEPFADVGMVVAKSCRRQGIATALLRALSIIAAEGGRRAVCSTEVDNIAAQKSIERAGFVPRHRILTFEF